MLNKHALITSFIFGCALFFITAGKGDVIFAQSDRITLPEPQLIGDVSLEESLLKRRSHRSFLQKKLTQEQLSQLLWASQGITKKGPLHDYRTSPSAGGLYPMEIYIMTEEGLFHYIPKTHELESLKDGDLRKDLARAASDQGVIKEAPVSFIICAAYSRVTVKYKKRGVRYAHFEAGHIAQNILLQAVPLGLSAVPIGAFDDKEVQSLLGISDDHDPLYILPVGHAK